MVDRSEPVTPPSPCTGVCLIQDTHGWCEGCGRTLDEIAGWPAMTPAERAGTLTHLAGRLAMIRT